MSVTGCGSSILNDICFLDFVVAITQSKEEQSKKEKPRENSVAGSTSAVHILGEVQIGNWLFDTMLRFGCVGVYGAANKKCNGMVVMSGNNTPTSFLLLDQHFILQIAHTAHDSASLMYIGIQIDATYPPYPRVYYKASKVSSQGTPIIHRVVES